MVRKAMDAGQPDITPEKAEEKKQEENKGKPKAEGTPRLKIKDFQRRGNSFFSKKA